MSYGVNPEFATTNRERIFRYIVLAVLVLYTLRLGYLQIIQGSEYLQKSETQAIKQVTKEPFRGCMYDRNGKMIVQNSTSFCVAITPNDFNPETIPYVAKITGLPEDEIRKLYEDNKKYRFQQAKILRNASPEIIATIEENHEILPGVDIVVETKRVYDYKGNAAHLFGYQSEVNDDDIKNSGFYYKQRDVTGKTGIEKYWDNYLRGNKGYNFVAVNAAGQAVESFNKGKSDVDALEGNDLYLGIDTKLQEIAEREMKSDHGGIVVMDPRTGEVMALVSKPDYDLRLFTGNNFSEVYTDLSKQEDNPLFNRAMQTQYPPGSTWKMLMALAAMQEGIIDEHSTISCPGGYNYGGRFFKCHGVHGNVNAQRAIHVSCNTFFYKLGQQLGIDNYFKYGDMFNFGKTTKIDIAGEQSGLLASRSYFERHKITGNLINGRLVNLGIGQGEIGVTPLQMAAYCSALAMKGTYNQPHVVRSIYYRESKHLEKNAYYTVELPINKSYFDVIHRGMYDVCNTAGGTATNVKVDGIKVCGKTGTAQNPHGKDHSWFICFAPAENPTIAMCVMVENAGFGAERAAPIAREILNAYFHPEKVQSEIDSTSTKNNTTAQVTNVNGKHQ